MTIEYGGRPLGPSTAGTAGKFRIAPKPAGWHFVRPMQLSACSDYLLADLLTQRAEMRAVLGI